MTKNKFYFGFSNQMNMISASLCKNVHNLIVLLYPIYSITNFQITKFLFEKTMQWKKYGWGRGEEVMNKLRKELVFWELWGFQRAFFNELCLTGGNLDPDSAFFSFTWIYWQRSEQLQMPFELPEVPGRLPKVVWPWYCYWGY